MPDPVPGSAALRYPWRVRCSGCGWTHHFYTQQAARSLADRHNARGSWPHDAKVSTVSAAAWETECPKREDRQHCNHWYDDAPCCACGDDTKEAESA